MRAFAARSDLFVDQRKQSGENQAQGEDHQEHGLNDEDDVPGNPAFGEWPERTHSITSGEVEQNVAQSGEACEREQQSPARWKIGITSLAAAQTPEEIDKSNHCASHQRHSQKGMSESAVMV
jgi:hypothetical protein